MENHATEIVDECTYRRAVSLSILVVTKQRTQSSMVQVYRMHTLVSLTRLFRKRHKRAQNLPYLTALAHNIFSFSVQTLSITALIVAHLFQTIKHKKLIRQYHK